MDLTQRLAGRKAMVTGGSRGFGRAIALRLAEEGADVAISFQRAEERAKQVEEAITGLGRRAMSFQADASDPESSSAFVQAVEELFGQIDIVVCNAGVRDIANFADQPRAEWDHQIQTNIYGMLNTISAALPGMLRSRRGRIICTASQLAHVGGERFAIYSGTKAFVLAFVKSVAREVGPQGITVNAVCPGSIVTEMNATTYTPEKQAERAATLPLRHLGSPDDIASAVAYLASDDGAFVTGQCVDVNGGATMA
jgi:3-oxoacyl-[acyl-carrier protein] reductase